MTFVKEVRQVATGAALLRSGEASRGQRTKIQVWEAVGLVRNSVLLVLDFWEVTVSS